MLKEYYIFGEDICRAYNSVTEEELLEEFKDESFGLSEFVVGETSFFKVLEAFEGYLDFAQVPEELYWKLKELQNKQEE